MTGPNRKTRERLRAEEAAHDLAAEFGGVLVVYDINLDGMRPATQADIYQMAETVRMLARFREAISWDIAAGHRPGAHVRAAIEADAAERTKLGWRLGRDVVDLTSLEAIN